MSRALKPKIEPVWLSVTTAAELTSYSADFIRREVVEKGSIPIFKDTECDDPKRASVRFRAEDFWDWFEKRFGAKPKSA